MPLLISGLLVSLIIFLLAGLYYSFFPDKLNLVENNDLKNKDQSNMNLSRCGMITKKTSLKEPLFLIGDCKVQ